MLKYYFKKSIYLITVMAVFSANAGSYEDFFVAIKNDNTSNLASLLARCFDPNTRDPKGQPGLTMALQERSPRTVKLLIERADIDVNALNNAGEDGGDEGRSRSGRAATGPRREGQPARVVGAALRRDRARREGRAVADRS